MPSSEYNDTTTHYSFNKPHTDAPVNIEDLNANMDTLDSTLYSVETKANASKAVTDNVVFGNSSYKINPGIASSDQSAMWKDFGGKDGYCGIRAVRGNSSMAWLPSTYGSGLMVGVADTVFYIGGNHNSSSATPTVSFAGGTSGNSGNVSNSDPNWYFKIQGANGSTYDLRSLARTSVTGDSYNATLNSANVDITGSISGYITKFAGVATIYGSIPLIQKTSYSDALIMTVPSGYRPSQSMYFYGFVSISQTFYPFQLRLKSDNGELYMSSPSGITIPSSPRLTFDLTYVQ